MALADLARTDFAAIAAGADGIAHTCTLRRGTRTRVAGVNTTVWADVAGAVDFSAVVQHLDSEVIQAQQALRRPSEWSAFLSDAVDARVQDRLFWSIASGAGGVGAAGQFTLPTPVAANAYAGLYLVDGAGAYFPIAGNTATVLSVTDEAGAAVAPADGSWSVRRQATVVEVQPLPGTQVLYLAWPDALDTAKD